MFQRAGNLSHMGESPVVDHLPTIRCSRAAAKREKFKRYVALIQSLKKTGHTLQTTPQDCC